MDLEILSATSEATFQDKLDELIKKYNVVIGRKVTSLEKIRKMQEDKPRLSIVIDGPTLVYAFKDEGTS